MPKSSQKSQDSQTVEQEQQAQVQQQDQQPPEQEQQAQDVQTFSFSFFAVPCQGRGHTHVIRPHDNHQHVYLVPTEDADAAASLVSTLFMKAVLLGELDAALAIRAMEEMQKAHDEQLRASQQPAEEQPTSPSPQS